MFVFKVKKTAHSIKELSNLDRDPKPGDEEIAEFEPLQQPYANTASSYYTIFEHVAYWRKFNALHQWFVTYVQIGIDDCSSLYELDRDDLLSCLETLEKTLHQRNSAFLPPTKGFFWGSTEVDDYYWRDVEDGVKIISELIEKTNWDKERLFYQSSW